MGKEGTPDFAGKSRVDIIFDRVVDSKVGTVVLAAGGAVATRATVQNLGADSLEDTIMSTVCAVYGEGKAISNVVRFYRERKRIQQNQP